MRRLPDGTPVVWEPLPGSQTLAMSCPAQITIVSGSRGGGKTDNQLFKFRRNVGQGYGKHWQGVIFDREYKNLDDLVKKSMRWFPMFNDGARFLSSKADYKWVWKTGEELSFRTVSKEDDYWNYHGHEYPFIGWNELTKYPTSSLFEQMMSCNRSSFRPEDYPLIISRSIYKSEGRFENVSYDHPDAMEYLLPPIPLEVFITTNPYGVGHNWVKKKFIDVAPPGKIHSTTVNVYNPQTGEKEDVSTTQVHIFSSYRENKYLDPKYVVQLESLTDKNKRQAWLFGNWDIVAGGMFDDVWDKDHHVIQPFDVPASWKMDRSFDYGSSRPFSVGWWAESDGTPYKAFDGTIVKTVKGDLFRIAEWYGCSEEKANTGLRMLLSDISFGIIERELEMKIHSRVKPGPADSAIYTMENGNSFADHMLKPVTIGGKRYKGVAWVHSNKSPGTRVEGWEKMRAYFKASLPATTKDWKGDFIVTPRDKPGLFIFNSCHNFIEQIPVLSRDEKKPDDIDTNCEDHIADEARYRLLGEKPQIIKSGATRGT